jgi:hypothetical protein
MLSQEINFYQLWDKVGHARKSIGNEFFFRLSDNQGRLSAWPDITWTWEPMKGHEGEPPSDFPAAIIGPSLVSARMREIIDSHLGPADDVQWIPSVMHFNDEEIPYWIPHFPHNPDVLNAELSTWGENGVPMRWVLDARKLHDHEFFNAWGDKIIVSNRLRLALRKAGITGINPKRVRMDC